MIVNTTIIAELCVYILTWNVGSKEPNDVNMNDMLSLNGTTSCPGGQLPDLYVLGFQEVKVHLNLFFFEKEDDWTWKIQEHLSSRDYVKLRTEKLQGMLINVWSQAKHLEHINAIETATTKTGFAGLWGNKGAVSLRMSLYGTATTFVVAHLAAHDDELQQRIDDYHRIVENHLYMTNNYPSIYHHDFIFWAGDLNFRLNGQESAKDISSKIREGQLDDLFTRDQLQMVKESGQAFSVLNETRPLFPPTYKFHEGTSDYNLKRRPAWCDRILYNVKNKYPNISLGLQQLSYKSHPQYVLSDHKPVTAEFLLTIKADGYINRTAFELSRPILESPKDQDKIKPIMPIIFPFYF